MIRFPHPRAAAIPMLTLALAAAFWGCAKPPYKDALDEARTLAKHSEFRKAVEVLNDAIQAHPDVPDLHRERLHILLMADNAQAAEQAYQLLKKKLSKDDPILVKSLTDSNPVVRAAAAKTLADLREASALKPLCQATTDGDAEVRRAVVVALGRLRNTEAVPHLVKRLADEAWEVRGDAAAALGLIGDSTAIDPLFGVLADADGYVRSTAASALVDLAKEPAKASYTARLQDPNPMARLTAALALARIGDREGVPLIYASMKTAEDPQQRSRCIEALARMQNPEDFAALKAMLADPNPTVRFKAVDSMRFVPDASSIPILRQIAADTNAPASLRDHANKVANAIELWASKQKR
ncbi:MAG TPA: HEAT repeat domain-containing protein [Verrucomicrobiae bacterium]|mgnify:CR=1 FL=1|nr:HEAT repeat domain-containing protein [Verrucomicrobiae bacterium]